MLNSHRATSPPQTVVDNLSTCTSIRLCIIDRVVPIRIIILYINNNRFMLLKHPLGIPQQDIVDQTRPSHPQCPTQYNRRSLVPLRTVQCPRPQRVRDHLKRLGVVHLHIVQPHLHPRSLSYRLVHNPPSRRKRSRPPSSRIPRSLDSSQRTTQRRRNNPLTRRQIRIPRRQREQIDSIPSMLPNRLDNPHPRRHTQVSHHPAHNQRLLNVFLPKVDPAREDRVEQLGHHRRHAPKERGARLSFHLRGERWSRNNIRPELFSVRDTRGIELGCCGKEHGQRRAELGRGQQPHIRLECPWVSRQIFVRGKLGGVDVDRNDGQVVLFERFADWIWSVYITRK